MPNFDQKLCITLLDRERREKIANFVEYVCLPGVKRNLNLHFLLNELELGGFPSQAQCAVDTLELLSCFAIPTKRPHNYVRFISVNHLMKVESDQNEQFDVDITLSNFREIHPDLPPLAWDALLELQHRGGGLFKLMEKIDRVHLKLNTYNENIF